jgi:hypothetical protein
LPESQHGRPRIVGECNVILHLPELLQRRDWDLLLLHNFVAEIKFGMCSMKILSKDIKQIITLLIAFVYCETCLNLLIKE